MAERRKPRSYTDELKQQIVQLYWIFQGERHFKTGSADFRTSSYYYEAKQPQYNVVVSDLIYVRAGNSWNYICVLVDLFNREIIGYSAGKNKDAALVSKVFSRVDVNLNKIQIFHTDSGNEFKNRVLDETLEAFEKIFMLVFGKHTVFALLDYVFMPIVVFYLPF